jgi:cardiolipin synthase
VPSFVPDNRVEVLIDGGPFFRALIGAIEQAQHYVLVESYILAADQTGWRVARALAAKARAGVEVALSYDGFGSLFIDPYFLDFLKDAGVKVFEFRPVSFLRGHWPWSRRNHRKLCVVDGRIGIVGGMNISDDYASVDDGGRGWRDMGVRIEGPAVAQLETLARRLWKRYAKQPLASVPVAAPVFPGGHAVQFVANFARKERALIRRSYLRAIVQAEHSVQITAAYFAPDPGLLRALRRASARGVAVEIITAGATDVRPVLWVARGLYGILLRGGVRIFEWRERILHAKAAVVDGKWTTIGSANLNHRTYLMDFEVNATILGTEIAGLLEDQFLVDRARSTVITLEEWRQRPWAQRLLSWFFGLFRRMM